MASWFDRDRRAVLPDITIATLASGMSTPSLSTFDATSPR
jgi:hypothetical protein